MSSVWALQLHPPLVPIVKHSAFLVGLVHASSGPLVLLMHDLLHFAYCEAKFGHFAGSWKNLFLARARVWRQFCPMLAELLGPAPATESERT